MRKLKIEAKKIHEIQSTKKTAAHEEPHLVVKTLQELGHEAP